MKFKKLFEAIMTVSPVRYVVHLYYPEDIKLKVNVEVDENNALIYKNIEIMNLHKVQVDSFDALEENEYKGDSIRNVLNRLMKIASAEVVSELDNSKSEQMLETMKLEDIKGFDAVNNCFYLSLDYENTFDSVTGKVDEINSYDEDNIIVSDTIPFYFNKLDGNKKLYFGLKIKFDIAAGSDFNEFYQDIFGTEYGVDDDDRYDDSRNKWT